MISHKTTSGSVTSGFQNAMSKKITASIESTT